MPLWMAASRFSPAKNWLPKVLLGRTALHEYQWIIDIHEYQLACMPFYSLSSCKHIIWEPPLRSTSQVFTDFSAHIPQDKIWPLWHVGLWANCMHRGSDRPPPCCHSSLTEAAFTFHIMSIEVRMDHIMLEIMGFVSVNESFKCSQISVKSFGLYSQCGLRNRPP